MNNLSSSSISSTVWPDFMPDSYSSRRIRRANDSLDHIASKPNVISSPGKSTLFEPEFWFSNPAYKAHYLFESNEFGMEREIVDYVAKNNLGDFLLWLKDAIADIFGNIQKSLQLYQCWDENSPHLVLTLFSELDDMDELSAKEDQLFEAIVKNGQDDSLEFIVIAQR